MCSGETASKNHPVSTVKAPPLNPHAFAAEICAAGVEAGFRWESYGEIEGYPLLALTKRSVGFHPRIYLSTGIHGDEPAAPLALLAMLRAGLFDDRATWFLCPMLNPTGLARGTRENHEGRDLNRDYKDLHTVETRAHVNWLRRQPRFDLALCLHEDWESQGFYLYELNPDNRPTLAPAMLVAAAEECAIESTPIIDGRESVAPGIIRPVNDPLLRENWPEAIYLRHHHTTLNYTLESPSILPLDKRIRVLHCAVQSALRLITRG